MPIERRNQRPVIGVAGDTDLATYESARSFRFPGSYRKFAKEYGAGMINDYYRISVPYAERQSRLDMSYFTEGEYPLSTNYSPKRLADRVVLFADDIEGNLFGWDRDSRTQVRPIEYAVVLLPADTRKVSVVAKTFLEFVATYCFDVPFSGNAWADAEINFRFEPAGSIKRLASRVKFQTPKTSPVRSQKYQAWLDNQARKNRK